MAPNKSITRWFSSSQLPNHADNTTFKDEKSEQLFFVRPSESVMVIGREKYCQEYSDQLNEAVQEAHDKITERLNSKYGTLRAMEAKASSSL